MNKIDFVWGVATAAYQIEGGYREDGKGDSIWDTFSHDKNRIKNGDTGDVACDHYHKYKQDIELLDKLGVKAYRFSIAWTRILPDGTGKINQKGLDFYNNLINELLKYGIEPFVTLFHWDYPQKLFEKGGWLNPESSDWFYNYAKIVGKAFGDRVKNFITINEPQCILGGMVRPDHAPGMNFTVKDRLTAVHNILKAHGKAVIALRETVENCRVGYAPCGYVTIPKDNSSKSIEFAKKVYFSINKDAPTDNVALFSDPVMLGDYPEEYYRYFKDILPEISTDDMKIISTPIDYYCQNIYQGQIVYEGKHSEVIYEPFRGGKTSLGWNIIPQVMYWGPKFLYERYKKPIFITENGTANADVVCFDGQIHDAERIDFIDRYVEEMNKAIKDGVDIRGYFYWSFMDNMEWNLGYDPRFGLVYVDYETQERIPKDSFYYYSKLIKK